MLSHVSFSLLLGTAGLFHVAHAGPARHLHARDGVNPSLTHDPNTTTYCSWWADLVMATSCASLLSENAITEEQFRRWNPSVSVNCGTLPAGRSYCVEAQWEPVVTTSRTTITATTTPRPTTTSSSSSTRSTTSTTTPSNGVETPSPTQPGMVSNCNKFVKVNPGDTCDTIAFYNGPISTEDLVLWNTGVGGRDCRKLQAGTYVCVGVIGGGTPTKPSNGIATPSPIQTGMVSSCNKFVKVNPGDSCDGIAFFNGPISTEDFKKWNPGVGADCRTLQAGTYACVGVIGSSTPTKPGNGVTTPSPTQGGMVTNCNKFVKVNAGDTCDGVAFFNGPISTEDFKKWNPGVGSDCRFLQEGTYACIGVMK